MPLVAPPPPPDHWPEQLRHMQKSYELSKAIFDYQKRQDDIRKKNVEDSLAKIKELFGARSPIYNQLRQESMELNRGRLEELEQDASRNTRFALARAGNVGGSTEVDKNAELAEKMGLGLGQAEIYAQGQADQLKAQDEALRTSLSTMAASGAVTGNQLGAQGRSALSGLRGTASYMRDMDNTFAGLTNQIGAAGNRQAVQQPVTSTRSTPFGY